MVEVVVLVLVTVEGFAVVVVDVAFLVVAVADVMTAVEGARVGILVAQFEPAKSALCVLLSGQQPCMDDKQSLVAVAGQFEPSGSLLWIPVPEQHPCEDNKHPTVADTEVIVMPFIGQFDPAVSRFRVFVPGQHPCRDDEQNCVTFSLVPVGMTVARDFTAVLDLFC